MNDTMRDAFEAWITKPLKNGRSLSDAMNDQQREIAKETWCDAWQAAQSQPAPPVPQTVQDIMRLVIAYANACVKFTTTKELTDEYSPLEAALTALVSERARLKFELDGVNAMRGPEWKPIDSAPKDGRHILIANDAPGSVHPREAYYVLPEHRYDNEPPEPGWWRLAGSTKECVRGRTPTHWQPLPPPPTHGIEPEQGEVKS